MGNDRGLRAIAYAIIAVALLAQVVSTVDPARPVAEGLWPLAIVAAGYLFGVKVIGGKDDNGRK